MKPPKKNRAPPASDPPPLPHVLRPRPLRGRWVAPLVAGLVAFGGTIVPPAVAGSASTCDSYNPTLFKAGTTYEVVTRYSVVHGPPFIADAETKVMGPVTFRGHKLIELRHHIKIAYPVSKTSSIVDEFYKIGRTFIYYYGSRGQSRGGSYSDPPLPAPKHYVINIPYTSTNVMRTIDDGTTTSGPPVHKTSTFLGMETTTVPAGTFSACKIQEKLLFGSEKKPRTIYVWIVSSGRYAGLPIKSDDYSATGSSTRKMTALSLRVDGK